MHVKDLPDNLDIGFRNTKTKRKLSPRNKEALELFNEINADLVITKTGTPTPTYLELLEHGDPDFWLEELEFEMQQLHKQCVGKPLHNKKAKALFKVLATFNNSAALKPFGDDIIADFYKVCAKDLRDELGKVNPYIFSVLYKHTDGKIKVYAPRHNYWAGVYQDRLEQQGDE